MKIAKVILVSGILCVGGGNAYAAPSSVFSYQEFDSTKEQCQAVARFVTQAVTQVQTMEDYARLFALEYQKRSVPARAGAYINTAIDKAIYLHVAKSAFDAHKAAAILRNYPNTPAIEADCAEYRDDYLRRLKQERYDEIQDIVGKPDTTENILGENVIRNIDMMCDQLVKETYPLVATAQKEQTEELARQKFKREVRRANSFRTRNQVIGLNNILLPNTDIFVEKMEEFRLRIADDLFAGKEDRGRHLGQCRKMSQDFWLKVI